ncbi:MAG: diphthine synthase [archaeon]|jgi:diphthine synthase
MFYLIGIGLKPKHITLEAISAIKDCNEVYLEKYTSQYVEGENAKLEEIIGKKVVLINREEVEVDFENKIKECKEKNIALLIFGNALTATTHIQLLIDAKEAGIDYKVIPGISVTNTIAESGLDEYKFGRTVTICYHLPNFEPESFYDQILANQKLGLHTLCLLDIKKDQANEMMMNANEAIAILEKIKAKRNDENNFEYLALVGMTNSNQKIVFGKEKINKCKEVNEIFPQSLIVLGKANEKEMEAIKLYE